MRSLALELELGLLFRGSLQFPWCSHCRHRFIDFLITSPNIITVVRDNFLILSVSPLQLHPHSQLCDFSYANFEATSMFKSFQIFSRDAVSPRTKMHIHKINIIRIYCYSFDFNFKFFQFVDTTHKTYLEFVFCMGFGKQLYCSPWWLHLTATALTFGSSVIN